MFIFIYGYRFILTVKVIIALKRFENLKFVKVMRCVFFEVQTKFLNVPYTMCMT
jgi:hypothetical protein